MENQDSSSTNVVQVPVENPDVHTTEAYDDTIYRPSPLTEFIGDFYIEEFSKIPVDLLRVNSRFQSTQVPQDPVHSGFQAADGEVDGVKGW